MKNLIIVISLMILSGCANQTSILMYHDINDDSSDQWAVSPEQFANHMDYLKRNDYKVIPITALGQKGAKQVVITFDDGYQSFIEHAWPVLQEYNFPATINIVGNWVGGTIPPGRKALSWDEIRMLNKTELVQFGNHTFDMHTHEGTGVLISNKEEWNNDLTLFRGAFVYEVGITTDILAWPYGMYSTMHIDVAKEHGFKYFQTMISGTYDGNNTELKRLTIKRDTRFNDLLDGLK